MTATGKSESSSGIDGARMGHFGLPDVGLKVGPLPSLARSHYRFGKPKSNYIFNHALERTASIHADNGAPQSQQPRFVPKATAPFLVCHLRNATPTQRNSSASRCRQLPSAIASPRARAGGPSGCWSEWIQTRQDRSLWRARQPSRRSNRCTQSARGTHTWRVRRSLVLSRPRHFVRRPGRSPEIVVGIMVRQSKSVGQCPPDCCDARGRSPRYVDPLGLVRSESQTASATALCPPAAAGRPPLGPSPPPSAACNRRCNR